MRAVFLDSETLDRGDLDLQPLRQWVPELEVHRRTGAADIAGRIDGAGIVILNKVHMHRQLIEDAGALQLICLAATGSDNVDLEAARQRGVKVRNIRGYCSASVVQHVFAMMLSLTQYLEEFDALARGGAWQQHPHFCMLSHPQRELSGLTLGIVGYGELGKAVHRTAGAFGMRVQVSQRPGQPVSPGRVSLEQLLKTSDVVSLHCPLNAQTRHLIGERELALMKPDALLVNTARGALVDPQALADALRSGQLGGAGIDVLEQEPPVAGNPLLDPSIPRLILTPHIAWAALQSRQRALEQIAENIQAFLRGIPLRDLA
ncbi:MAG: D-2-hydroxyacid dehydrogenase [Gammaproteobacteria bacterium]|jgi:glycerate dehydrogenase|nr:D-2-hydroxyacid dehydrogenase [Gammaproteobacteria bacterium]